MGRSATRSIVPRAYIFVPIPRVYPNTGVSTPYDPTAVAVYPLLGSPAQTQANRYPFASSETGRARVELGAHQGQTANKDRGGASYVHGVVWSMDLNGAAASTNTIDINQVGSAITVYGTGGNTLTSTIASNPISGFIERCVLNTGTLSGARQYLKGSANGAGSNVFGRSGLTITPATNVEAQEPAGFAVVSAELPGTHSDATGASISPIHLGPETHFPGPASGFYAVIPVPTTPVGTSVTSLTTVRTITAPMSMRIQQVQFPYRSSAAGNSVRLFNVTQNAAITAETSITSTTAAVPRIGASTLTNRNINKGDVIAIQAKTGATAGIVSLSAVIVVHTTGHAVTKSDQDRLLSLNAYDAAHDPTLIRQRRNHGPHLTFSGPCTGSIVCLPFGDHLNAEGAFPTSTSNHLVASIYSPFDITVFGGQVVYNTGSAGNTFKIRNFSTSTDLTGAIALTTASSPVRANIRNSDLVAGTTEVSRGDVLSLYMTTGSTAVTALAGWVFAYVRGHVNASPSFD